MIAIFGLLYYAGAEFSNGTSEENENTIIAIFVMMFGAFAAG